MATAYQREAPNEYLHPSIHPSMIYLSVLNSDCRDPNCRSDWRRARTSWSSPWVIVRFFLQLCCSHGHMHSLQPLHLWFVFRGDVWAHPNHPIAARFGGFFPKLYFPPLPSLWRRQFCGRNICWQLAAEVGADSTASARHPNRSHRCCLGRSTSKKVMMIVETQMHEEENCCFMLFFYFSVEKWDNM